jgi:hypothetical protein
MNEFYTYAYLREDRTPYYIGRGKGRRAHQKHTNVKTPPEDRVLILKSGLTFEESVKHEVYMIEVLGRKVLGAGGLLWNFTSGGEGRVAPHTEASKAKMSVSHKGKTLSPEHKSSISKALKNREVSLETREKLREKRATQVPPTLGQNRTPEQRERMRQAAILRWSKTK